MREKEELREIVQAFHVQAYNLIHAIKMVDKKESVDNKEGVLTEILNRSLRTNNRIQIRLDNLVERDDCMQ